MDCCTGPVPVKRGRGEREMHVMAMEGGVNEIFVMAGKAIFKEGLLVHFGTCVRIHS